jgi:hypothetical protein
MRPQKKGTMLPGGTFPSRPNCVSVALNQSLYVVGRVLGHKKASTTQRYSHLQLDPLRAAADQTAKRVADAMKGRGDNSKVVRLARPK